MFYACRAPVNIWLTHGDLQRAFYLSVVPGNSYIDLIGFTKVCARNILEINKYNLLLLYLHLSFQHGFSIMIEKFQGGLC